MSIRIACFKKEELAEVLFDLLKLDSTMNRHEIDTSEDDGCECLYIYNKETLVKTYKLKELFALLSTHVEAEITSYDVMEVGDHGDMFTFFLKENNLANVA